MDAVTLHIQAEAGQLDNADVTQGEVLDNERSQVQVRSITSETLLHADSLSYDTLCTLAGTNNLGSVRNLTMRLRCSGPHDSLRRVPRLMPFLSSLYLDNSIIPNFRVFGEEVPSLKVLSVCSCGLTELFGADFLVSLTELYAARNSINNVT